METEIKLVNVLGLSRRLRLPAAWLRAEAEARRVPCLRAGDTFLFDPDALEAALLERARKGATAND